MVKGCLVLKNKISSTRDTLSRLGVVSCCDMLNGTTHAVVTVKISNILIYNNIILYINIIIIIITCKAGATPRTIY